MLVYNRHLTHITLPSKKHGNVTFNGAWRRQNDADQTAINGGVGVTEIPDNVWVDLLEEFKGVHLIKAGQIFAAKNEIEAKKKADDVEKPASDRLTNKELSKNGIEKLSDKEVK